MGPTEWRSLLNCWKLFRKKSPWMKEWVDNIPSPNGGLMVAGYGTKTIIVVVIIVVRQTLLWNAAACCYYRTGQRPTTQRLNGGQLLLLHSTCCYCLVVCFENKIIPGSMMRTRRIPEYHQLLHGCPFSAAGFNSWLCLRELGKTILTKVGCSAKKQDWESLRPHYVSFITGLSTLNYSNVILFALQLPPPGLN